MSKVRVLFFATFRDRAGRDEDIFKIPEACNVMEFKNILEDRYPGLGIVLKTGLVAVNHNFAFDEDIIPDDAEIAVFPPVSGGSDDLPTIIAITQNEVQLNDLVNQIMMPETGAACIFSGIVRGVTTRKQFFITDSLQYEAYIPMAEKKMKIVVDEIRSRWPEISGIAIIQRIGHLEPGEQTVVIACTAAHRDSGVFEAARYGIDRLKEIVPIWKKEINPGGEEWVEGEYIPGRNE